MTTNDVLAANPKFTYGQAVGYVSGQAASVLGKQFAGLSVREWREATDDYAHGYRAGYNAGNSQCRG